MKYKFAVQIIEVVVVDMVLAVSIAKISVLGRITSRADTIALSFVGPLIIYWSTNCHC